MQAADERSAGALVAVSGESRERVAEFWDRTVAHWLAGADLMPDPLPLWFDSYRGLGLGQVTREALPEPWIGPLLGRPRLLVLGLNPGGADLRFQGREGLFANEIRTVGGFTKWAASAPYTRPPWTDLKGTNPYHNRRVAFARRFYRDDSIGAGDVLAMELYPWHSRRVTARMTAPPQALDCMLWAPLAEIDLADIFAFGRPWTSVAEQAELPLEGHYGAGGTSLGSTVKSRQIRIYRLPSGQRLVACSQAGYAGPPGLADTRRLREVLTE